jgi:hypothetical protein
MTTKGSGKKKGSSVKKWKEMWNKIVHIGWKFENKVPYYQSKNLNTHGLKLG